MGLLPAYGFDLMRTKATTQSSLQRTSERASRRRFGGRTQQQQQKDRFWCAAKILQHEDCCWGCLLAASRRALCSHTAARAIGCCCCCFFFVSVVRPAAKFSRTHEFTCNYAITGAVERTDKAAVIRCEYLNKGKIRLSVGFSLLSNFTPPRVLQDAF